MGVKIRERSMESGEVASSIDTHHKDFGRVSQKTGVQAASEPEEQEGV